MKKPGNHIEFNEDRDRALHREFMAVLRTATDVPLREMFGMAAMRPAPRFWVSESRAAIVIGAMMRGHTPERMNPKRREMFLEIHRRVVDKMAGNPEMCMTHAVNETVYEEAPEFYLQPETARSIIYRFIQKRKAKK